MSTGKESGKKTYYLMVQGTMSSAGKSLLVAGLARVFRQDGYRVVPFKSQNMALNSYVTEDGLEMGRAQVMQAEAAGIKPSVYMNPILLKPTDDCGSQVIVNGTSIGNMRAREYFSYKTKLWPEIDNALDKLGEQADIIVIEGAGSPAEINLKSNDIVNMGIAKHVNAPVLLVGDIDRGGVFAQLYGTVELLEEEEKSLIAGLVINKFRGDRTILDPGIDMIEKKCNIPVVGVVPYMDINVEDEDSLTNRFGDKRDTDAVISVIRLPHIANFTDFNVFDQSTDVSVRYISTAREVEESDLVIIPGTKNTIADLKWMKERGIDTAVIKYAAKQGCVIGICGGYQILGERIDDPDNLEAGGSINGLGLLPVSTVLTKDKVRSLTTGQIVNSDGALSGLSGLSFSGYEIHMGRTTPVREDVLEFTSDGTGYKYGNIYGSYIHGLFDEDKIALAIINSLLKMKGIERESEKIMSLSQYKELQYDRLADYVRQSFDMDYIYRTMGIDRGDTQK